MKFEWKISTARFSSGELLFLNGIKLGSVFYARGCDPKGSDNPPYAIDTTLPTMSPRIKRYQSRDEAKKALEDFSERWIARLTRKDTP